MTGAAEPLDFELDDWDAWTPAEAVRHLERLEAPWCAGWALDLFLGRQTREHDDLEIGVPSHRFTEVRTVLGDFELVVVGGGKAWPLDPRSLATHHQTWVRDRDGGPWRMDVFREPWDGEVWTCRRDTRIRLPASRLISHTSDGIPYAQPEVVLLFKANSARPKDEDDFATVLPHLDADRRRWLREALALVNPEHRWLAALATP
jgi:hypothetical protein